MRSIKTRIIEMCRNSSALNSAAQYAYLNILRSPSWWSRHSTSREPARYPSDGPVHPVRAAFICDEMTWIDLAPQCESIYLWPDSWREQMEEFQPELLFCESAWSGIPPMEGCWRGRIYKNRSVFFENRRVLLDILSYCGEHKIPTMFWNKEDPPLSQQNRYDFYDTAIRFDAVFTTAEECVPVYQELGCRHIYVMPFMVNTAVYYPGENLPCFDESRVLFAGSWNEDLPERCEAAKALFEYVLQKGASLDIYDRHSGDPEKRFRFPKEYAPYICPAVPVDKVPDLMRRYSAAINVNTVTKSNTMFSRRALHLAACGVKIISNPSPGMEAALGGKRIQIGKDTRGLLIDPDHHAVGELFSASRAFGDIVDIVNLLYEEHTSAAGLVTV